MLGSIISAAASLIGGRRAQNSQEHQTQQNIDMQREFAQHGIRWRVEDAKAAGIHPLYALSSGGAAFSPNPVTVDPMGAALADAGQSIGRAVASQESDEQRKMRQLGVRLLEAQVGKAEAEAQMARSQAMSPSPVQAGVGFSSIGSAQTFPYREVEAPKAIQLDPTNHYSADYPGKFDMISPKPVEIESMSPDANWIAAGPARPGYQRFRITKNLEMLLPRNEEGWSEGLESVPYWMYPMVYQANKDYYGPDFWRVLVQELGPNNSFMRWVVSTDRLKELERHMPSREILDQMGIDYRRQMFNRR